MRSMRSILLTTVAAAALGGLPFQAHAQDRKQQSPSTLESSHSPASQQKGMQEKGMQEKGIQVERSGKSAAEPNQSGTEAHGKSSNRSAQEKLNSREAKPAQGAEKRSTEEGSMRNPSASSEPMQPEHAKRQKRGKANPAATEAERRHTMGSNGQNTAEPQNETRTRHTMGSKAPNTAEPQNETRMPEGRMTGGNETPNKAATGRSEGVDAMHAQGKEQRQGGAVTLNTRQQTSVVAALRNESVQRFDRADFAISVGTIVPAFVALNPLPESVVEIVPQYRGYDFVMVRDEIVIVEPRTRHIVTVLRGKGRSAATAEHRAAATSAHGHLQFTREQRQLIRRDLLTSEGVTLDSVEIGERVPADISLLSIPADVLDEVPDIRPYRYVVTSDQVVLVAPDTREIIDIID
jgi:Protein of unknown function (DUF1236)